MLVDGVTGGLIVYAVLTQPMNAQTYLYADNWEVTPTGMLIVRQGAGVVAIYNAAGWAMITRWEGVKDSVTAPLHVLKQ